MAFIETTLIVLALGQSVSGVDTLTVTDHLPTPTSVISTLFTDNPHPEKPNTKAEKIDVDCSAKTTAAALPSGYQVAGQRCYCVDFDAEGNCIRKECTYVGGIRG